MVPCPWASANVAFVALLRSTKNVSFGSTLVSPLTWTTYETEPARGAIVTVFSATLMKSSSFLAVPLFDLALIVMVFVEACDREIVNVALVVPLLPSVTDTLSIEIVGFAVGRHA